MKLEEAIAEQMLYLNHSDQWSHDRLDKAFKLGIAALLRELAWRQHDPTGTIHLLPGETE